MRASPPISARVAPCGSARSRDARETTSPSRASRALRADSLLPCAFGPTNTLSPGAGAKSSCVVVPKATSRSAVRSIGAPARADAIGAAASARRAARPSLRPLRAGGSPPVRAARKFEHRLRRVDVVEDLDQIARVEGDREIFTVCSTSSSS